MNARVECGSQPAVIDMASSVAPPSRVSRFMTRCCLVGFDLDVVAVFALVLPFVCVALVMCGSPVMEQLYSAPTPQSPAGQPAGVTHRVLPCGPCEALMLRLRRKSNGMSRSRLESSVKRDVGFVGQS